MNEASYRWIYCILSGILMYTTNMSGTVVARVIRGYPQGGRGLVPLFGNKVMDDVLFLLDQNWQKILEYYSIFGT